MTGKNYRGNKPDGDGWEIVGAVEDDLRWLVFVRENANSEWLSVKVVADGRAPNKANYWLGWNGKRFAQQGDGFTIMQQRQTLLGSVKTLMEALDLL
jgi:hypothetical protein